MPLGRGHVPIQCMNSETSTIDEASTATDALSLCERKDVGEW